MQKELLLKAQVSEIGQHVGIEAGEEMVKRFFDKHPDLATGHIIGKNILNKILSQPGCEGVTILPSYDENGNMHLVYLGVDADYKPIVTLNVVNPDGTITSEEALVGDKSSNSDFVTDSGW